jgi:hypothetical protein
VFFGTRRLRERLRVARPMFAGRPQEAASNGSPRWMAAGPPSGGCTEPGLQADSSAAHSVVPEHYRSARQHGMDHGIPRTGRSTQLTDARVDVGNDGRAAGAHIHLVVGMFIRHIFLDDHGPAWLPDALNFWSENGSRVRHPRHCCVLLMGGRRNLGHHLAGFHSALGRHRSTQAQARDFVLYIGFTRSGPAVAQSVAA